MPELVELSRPAPVTERREGEAQAADAGFSAILQPGRLARGGVPRRSDLPFVALLPGATRSHHRPSYALSVGLCLRSFGRANLLCHQRLLHRGDGRRLARNSRAMSDYFIRRFRRIFPPYWGVLIGYALLIAVFDLFVAPGLITSQPRMEFRPWWFSPSQWFGNITLTETWRHHLFGSQRAHYVGQSWTLCYEEQFYAVVGLILAVSSRHFFLSAIVISFATVIARIVASALAVNIDGFFFDGMWLLFAEGILVYYYALYATRRGRVVILVALAAFSIWQIAAGNPLGLNFAAASAFATAIALFYHWDRAIAGSIWIRPLTICGTMCYSLYLVHQIFVVIISKALYRGGVTSGVGTLLWTIPFCVAVSVAAGWLFYLLVERRFLNVRRIAA